jgi:exodeoxyribonuclease VII large subunit
MEPLELFSHREILRVSELVGRLKRLTERNFDFVWVEGEISGLRRPGSGHVYFTLKDDKAAIRAVLFRPRAAMLRFQLEEGLSVLCQGNLSVYAPRGDVQLIAETMEPRGAGALALAVEQLKRRLAEEGLFEASRKQSLPELPRRVAVVTSPSGAAVRDFLKVLHRRFAGVEVYLYPVLVQGDQAAGQVARALEDLAAWGRAEVIVITRGGGSAEDLMPFNDEALARAVAACPVPVVSAVGHEVDVTICDLVADLRAPTPSAAAELLVQPRADLVRRLGGLWQRVLSAGLRLGASRRRELRHLMRRLSDPRRVLAERRLRLDDLVARAGHGLWNGLHLRRRRLDDLARRLTAVRPDRRLAQVSAMNNELRQRLVAAQAAGLIQRRAMLDNLSARLRAMSPLAVLGRGYALVYDPEGRLVRRADAVRTGERIKVRLGAGSLRALVEEVEP